MTGCVKRRRPGRRPPTPAGPCVPAFDASDADLGGWGWGWHSGGYAAKWVTLPAAPGGKPRRVALLAHRVVMERVTGRPLRSDEYVNHRNFDRLDCRRANLRVLTPPDNARHVRAFGAAGLRGVSRCRVTRRWLAVVTHAGRRHRLGLFDTPAAAAVAAWAKRRELGFPDELPLPDAAGGA